MRKSATTLWNINPITEVPSPMKEEIHEQEYPKDNKDSFETSLESFDSRRKEEMKKRRAKFELQKLKYYKIKEKNDQLHSQLQQILKKIEPDQEEKKGSIIQFKVEKHKRSFGNVAKLKQNDLKMRMLTSDCDHGCGSELRRKQKEIHKFSEISESADPFRALSRDRVKSREELIKVKSHGVLSILSNISRNISNKIRTRYSRQEGDQDQISSKETSNDHFQNYYKCKEMSSSGFDTFMKFQKFRGNYNSRKPESSKKNTSQRSKPLMKTNLYLKNSLPALMKGCIKSN